MQGEIDMHMGHIRSLVAALFLLTWVAGCDDGLSEDEASTLIQQELVKQMNAGKLEWKRFPVVKINTSTNRASIANFPEDLKRWFYGAGFVKKGRGVSYEVITPKGLEYFESTPSIIDATEVIRSSSGPITERSFTFYTHSIEEIQIVGVKNLGDDTYEVQYKPIFKRVNDDYMKHFPQRSDPDPNRTMVFAKDDDEWKVK
jgi:hypothetical protein